MTLCTLVDKNEDVRAHSAGKFEGLAPKLIYFYFSLLFFHLLSFLSVVSISFHL